MREYENEKMSFNWLLLCCCNLYFLRLILFHPKTIRFFHPGPIRLFRHKTIRTNVDGIPIRLNNEGSTNISAFTTSQIQFSQLHIFLYKHHKLINLSHLKWYFICLLLLECDKG